MDAWTIYNVSQSYLTRGSFLYMQTLKAKLAQLPSCLCHVKKKILVLVKRRLTIVGRISTHAHTNLLQLGFQSFDQNQSSKVKSLTVQKTIVNSG
jgi:hypothetical protein